MRKLLIIQPVPAILQHAGEMLNLTCAKISCIHFVLIVLNFNSEIATRTRGGNHHEHKVFA